MSRGRRFTDADVARAVNLIKSLGLQASAVEVLPGKLRILTSEGALTIGGDVDLDQELAEHRKRHGYG